MSEIVRFTLAKSHLSELVDRVVREQDRIVVTRSGRPAAVLLSLDDLESLEETIEILGDNKLITSIRRSRKQAAAGKSSSLTTTLNP